MSSLIISIFKTEVVKEQRGKSKGRKGKTKEGGRVRDERKEGKKGRASSPGGIHCENHHHHLHKKRETLRNNGLK